MGNEGASRRSASEVDLRSGLTIAGFGLVVMGTVTVWFLELNARAEGRRADTSWGHRGVLFLQVVGGLMLAIVLFTAIGVIALMLWDSGQRRREHLLPREVASPTEIPAAVQPTVTRS